MASVHQVDTKQLFEPLRQSLQSYLKRKPVDTVYQAFCFAAKAHEAQTRSSGEPYVTHPLAVAMILADMHMDPDTIMAALLHDVMEDTSIDKALISEEFGGTVANLVDGVSKLTQIKFESKAEAQAENFRKMLLAMAKDIRVVVVKMADRLHNMRTLGPLTPQKRRRVAHETLEIYVPLANRLGMHAFCTQLENLCFEAMYPMRYRVLKGHIKKVIGHRQSIMDVINKAITSRLSEQKLKVIDFSGRQKHIYSIYRKMRNKHLAFSDIMDVFAFRITVNTLDDCYRTLGIIHNLYKPVPERFKDYIAIPKANGYQSLHTTLFGPYGVPIEVQIRTALMDDVAERGIAAHWLYKDGRRHDEPTVAEQRAQAWLQNLLELQRNVGSSVEFIENVKFDLFSDEVYVFTPKGEIIALPQNASAIDFAYAIHSDIGDMCVAVKIDRRYAPLSTKLKNGQTVEVVTAEHGVPKIAWLDFVVTGKARSNIRSYVKEQQRNEAVQLGEQLLNSALHFYQLNLETIDAERLAGVLSQLELEEPADLYSAIGMGEQVASVIAQKLVDKLAVKTTEISETSRATIRGTEGVMVVYAQCCYPIPGDPIVGYWLPSGQLLIHAEQCAKIDTQKVSTFNGVPLSWAENIDCEFESAIEIEIFDDKGILAVITQALLQEDISIQDIKVIHKSEGLQVLDIVIEVHNLAHLTRVMKRLEHLPKVLRVKRKQ